jgi:tripartite-type tricarboxylate transporter receptor subunit TctC
MPVNRTVGFGLAVAAGLFAALPSAAIAQAWPTRPVTWIVPFPAGGPADLLARTVATELSAKLGQQFVIENRAGAGGNLGGAAAAKAEPDGYTMLFSTPGPAAVNKLMYANAGYDPEKDLTPIVLVAKSPLIVVASKDAPMKDFKEMIAYARANPGKLNAGHPGNGTLGHITSKLVQLNNNVQITDLPYRGTAPLTTDLLGGQIHTATDFITTYIPLVQDDKIRALAVTSSQRVSKELPNVPTVAELGLAGFEATAWYAILTPAKTPADIVAKVNAAVNAWLLSPAGKAALEKFVMQGAGGTPADAKAYIASELAKWGPVIKASNIALN